MLLYELDYLVHKDLHAVGTRISTLSVTHANGHLCSPSIEIMNDLPGKIIIVLPYSSQCDPHSFNLIPS